MKVLEVINGRKSKLFLVDGKGNQKDSSSFPMMVPVKIYTDLDVDTVKIEGGIAVIDDNLKATKDAQEAEKIALNYQTERKAAYTNAGLTFEKFQEMVIEDDIQGIADYRAARDAIKAKYPKP